MSGTSADGINVAIIRVLGQGLRTRFQLLAHRQTPYPVTVRHAVLAMMNAPQAAVADLARLNFLLGELYAAALLRAQAAFKRNIQLIGCHGQTLYHQGEPAPYLGKKLSATWQSGEGAVVAARLGIPVVSDFRPADLAAGGQGAPLVPYLDYLFYRHPRRGRILQNVGGIANLTAIPANAAAQRVIAFDTGPGNMVIDATTQRLFGKTYDRGGSIAARGQVLEKVIAEILRQPFFRRPPPKSAGREQFGREFVSAFLARCKKSKKEDAVATATALTAKSIAQSLSRFVLGAKAGSFHDFIISGGGARNPTLLRMLQMELQPLALRLRTSDEFGLPAEAKEAVAFALLAYQTWRRQPSNLPAATGARRPAILGKISYA